MFQTQIRTKIYEVYGSHSSRVLGPLLESHKPLPTTLHLFYKMAGPKTSCISFRPYPYISHDCFLFNEMTLCEEPGVSHV